MLSNHSIGKATNAIGLAALFLLGVALGSNIWGEVRTAEAVHFDNSMRLMTLQSNSVDAKIESTSTIVEELVTNTDAGIDEVLAEWTPKYEQAKLVHAKFEASVAGAKARARAYLQSQRQLTARYVNEPARLRAEQDDLEEQRMFEAWAARADKVLDDTRGVMNAFNDLDIDLQKVKLRTDFTFASHVYMDVPTEIKSLQIELDTFKAESERLRLSTSSPFQE